MNRFALTPYGRREVSLAALVVTALGAGIVAAAWLARCWTLLAILVVPLAVWAWVLWFFRDPERAAPEGDGLFVSPADGRVTDITPLGADSALGREGVQIGIFMSVFDVHVNRCPETARVRKVEHRKGAFLDARDPAATERNESATISLQTALDGQEHAWIVRQVAGLIARRIVTDLAEGQSLARGQRIGMIKFGSRMEVLVPRELAAKVQVRVGQKVQAGKTVLLSR